MVKTDKCEINKEYRVLLLPILDLQLWQLIQISNICPYAVEFID
jgi:hypothetical protein